MSLNSEKCPAKVNAAGFEPKTTSFVNEHSFNQLISGKEFLDIQTTTECRLTLKRVCDMIRTHSLVKGF